MAVAAAIAAGVAADVTFKNSVEAVGQRAAGHLASASVFFPSLTVIFVLLWSTPRARGQADVWLAASAWAAGRYVVMVGNLRVVNAGSARTNRRWSGAVAGIPSGTFGDATTRSDELPVWGAVVPLHAMAPAIPLAALPPWAVRMAGPVLVAAPCRRGS